MIADSCSWNRPTSSSVSSSRASRATCSTSSLEIPAMFLLHTREAPFGAPRQFGSRKGLERRDVRRLQALVALHDFERDALTLGQRLVALTGDRGEVDEHVRLAVPALDEAVALFVREPLDRTFSHLRLLLAGMTTSPPELRRSGATLALF